MTTTKTTPGTMTLRRYCPCGSPVLGSRARLCVPCRSARRAENAAARRCSDCQRLITSKSSRCTPCYRLHTEAAAVVTGPQPLYGVIEVAEGVWAVRHPDPDRSVGAFLDLDRAIQAARERGLKVSKKKLGVSL